MNSVNTRGSSHPKEEIFEVDGMDCSEEVAAIERALKPVPGVVTVRAEIVSSKVTVSHDEKGSVMVYSGYALDSTDHNL